MDTAIRRFLARGIRRSAVVCALSATLPAGVARAQSFPPRVIHADTRWEGTIHIDRDVAIMAAVVEVAPGTTIRFTGGPATGEGPSILLNSPAVAAATAESARLLLQGTPQQPIVVETPAGYPPGAISAGSDTAASIVARHVIFRRLGAPRGRDRARPAVFVQLASPTNDLWLNECRFEECGPVHAEIIGPAASVEISRCTFRRTVGDRWLVLVGTGTGVKVVADNIADAGLLVQCPQVLLTGNVLTGETASMAVGGEGFEGLAIRGNYVHCTTAEDRGRYAVRCAAPGAVLENNVLIGGTYVVETAPARVTGNVLIGRGGLVGRFDLPGLQTGLGEVRTTTHHLIAELPAQGVIRDNLFLGPAYAALVVTAGVRSLEVGNNLFDGWGEARWAVRMLRAESASAVSFVGNACGGYREGCVAVGAADARRANRADGPAEAGSADRPAGFMPLTGVQPAATRFALSAEDRLLTRATTVEQVRRAWMECYRRAP